MAFADNDGVSRLANEASFMNTMPALELLVKPLMERPGKAIAPSTPGCFRATPDIFRITASVRSSDEAGGNCAKDTRYCLSCCGTKPVGTVLKPTQVSASRPPYTKREMPEKRNTRRTPPT